MLKRLFYVCSTILVFCCACSHNRNIRQITDFTEDWKFHLGDEPQALSIDFDDTNWRLQSRLTLMTQTGDYLIYHMTGVLKAHFQVVIRPVLEVAHCRAA